MIDLVNKTHDACLDWAADLSFNKDFQADGCVICLYGRLIELASCFHIIFSSERFSGCGIMFRSFLECHVDLDSCLNDENYHKNILAALFENIRKKLKAAKSNNPLLAEISKIENMAEQFDEANVELTKLKNEGFRPLNVFERFEKVKMEDVYRSIYALGSSEVHGDFSALLGHHVDVDPNNYHLSIYKMRSEAEFIAEIDSIVRYLLDSTIRVHERFKSKHLEAIRKFDEVVRAELSAEPTG